MDCCLGGANTWVIYAKSWPRERERDVIYEGVWLWERGSVVIDKCLWPRGRESVVMYVGLRPRQHDCVVIYEVIVASEARGRRNLWAIVASDTRTCRIFTCPRAPISSIHINGFREGARVIFGLGSSRVQQQLGFGIRNQKL